MTIMPNKVYKKVLVVVLGLIFAEICLALPLGLINPPNGAANVPVDGYFRWEHAGGATKYILDIDQFTQSEDNIQAYNVCPGDGFCYFYFLDLTAGDIDYLTPYQWNITAYDANGNLIDSSPVYSFSSEMPPAPPIDNGGGPIDLFNPLKAGSLWEAIDALINFLFVLAFAIAPILFIYAAFLMIFNRGDPGSIAKAKTIILWTVIALAIILFAKGLPAVIKGALGS